MNELLSCHGCGEPIGVYEPLITLVEGRAHETSRAATMHQDSLGTESYHRACFERHEEAHQPHQ